MPHVDDDLLAAWVLGDDDALDADAAAHVATCPDCGARAEGLRSVQRALGSGPLVAPPAGVRERVLAEVARESSSGSGPGRSAAVGDHGGGTPGQAAPVDLASRRRSRSVPLWAAGVAAAVTLVAGVGVGVLVNGSDDEQPEDEVVASTRLTTVEGTDPRGDARVVRDPAAGDDAPYTVQVDASSLGDADMHEVWLLNLDGQRMVSLGLLTADSATFEIPARLLDEGYVVLDISDEPDDGNPGHSGVSIARGELT